jgi:hypothetical protein
VELHNTALGRSFPKAVMLFKDAGTAQTKFPLTEAGYWLETVCTSVGN